MATKRKPLLELAEPTLKMRLNRKLILDGIQVRKAKKGKLRDAVGLYYLAKMSDGDLVETDVDLEEIGRRFGVLKPFEALDRSTVTT
jgi:hypothetical protein